MDRFNEAQSAIDVMFEGNRAGSEERATIRILQYAKRGMETPEAVSHKEVQQICYALVVHYAQMGIE